MQKLLSLMKRLEASHEKEMHGCSGRETEGYRGSGNDYEVHHLVPKMKQVKLEAPGTRGACAQAGIEAGMDQAVTQGIKQLKHQLSCRLPACADNDSCGPVGAYCYMQKQAEQAKQDDSACGLVGVDEQGTQGRVVLDEVTRVYPELVVRAVDAGEEALETKAHEAGEVISENGKARKALGKENPNLL